MFLEIESSKKQAEMDRKAIDDLVRERDILNKNLLKVNIRVADNSLQYIHFIHSEFSYNLLPPHQWKREFNL